MTEDPFDDIDPEEYADREGDPFASLDDESAPDDDGGRDDRGGHGEKPANDEPEDGGPANDEPANGGPAAGDGGPAAGTGGEERAVDVTGDPFGDVDVSRGDPFEGADSPFQQVDVDSVDPDEVWERLVDDESAPGESPGDEDDVVVVSKHRFCERCPHFTPPPEVDCTHGGTTIVGFLDPDEVRVSNCPVVRERRELGEVHE